MKNPLCSVLFVSSAFLLASATLQGADEDPRFPNRALIGTNLSGNADYSSQFAFVDLVKQGRPVQYAPKDFVETIDANGYPTSLEKEAYITLILNEYHPAGNYTVTWEGSATVTLPRFDAVREVEREPGRLVVEVQPRRGLYLHLADLDPEDPVRNLRVLLPGGAEAPTRFNPKFLSFIQPFGTLRFMDWMQTNNSTVSSWAERPTPEQLTFRQHGREGVPVEYMVELANTLRADPWFCMPHLADDDYVRRFATHVRDHLDPKLRAYIELSNEVWNWNFAQSRYARDQGEQTLGLKQGQGPHRAWYAKRSVEIFKIWEEVFGGTERLVRVIGTQSASIRVARQALEFEETWKHTDALAIAPYFGFNRELIRNIDVQADNVDQVLDLAEHVIETTVAEKVREHRALADQYELELIAYEAGQHLLARDERNNPQGGPKTTLFIAANRHPRMAELYRKYLDTWFANGGGVIAMFSSIAEPSRWGSWGMAEYLGQPMSEAHKYRAVVEAVQDPNLIGPKVSQSTR